MIYIGVMYLGSSHGVLDRHRRLKISRDVLKMDYNHYKILHALDRKTMPGPKTKRHLAISLVVHHINHGYHE